MPALDPHSNARDDWKRVEASVMFAVSVYWPFALLYLIPKDAAWWIFVPSVAVAFAVVSVLRHKHGLKQFGDDENG